MLLLTSGIKTLKHDCVGDLVFSWCLSPCWFVNCSLDSLPLGLVPPPGWGVQFNIFHLAQILDTSLSLISQGVCFIDFCCCCSSHSCCGMLSYYKQISGMLCSFESQQFWCSSALETPSYVLLVREPHL